MRRACPARALPAPRRLSVQSASLGSAHFVRIATLKESAESARKGGAMISSEVQRTLVKSPPELWAELSEPAALARHLGELGEIRITHIVPEKTVEWEAADTTGKVTLAPSGWGTKVTLSVTREPIEPESPPEPVIADEPEPESLAGEKPDLLDVEEVIVEESAPETIAEELKSEPEPERRQGFFAKIFRRHRKVQALPEPLGEPKSGVGPEPEPKPEVEQMAPDQPEAIEIDEPQQPQNEELPDIAAELKAAEEVAADEVTAMLTAVLDRLGAAHHRPFSRA
jgi:hypothetical protein